MPSTRHFKVLKHVRQPRLKMRLPFCKFMNPSCCISETEVATLLNSRDVSAMKNLIRRFSICEQGSIASAELVLLGTIICIGLLAGLTTWRDQMSLELADAADAISELDHSYTYSGISIAGVGFVAGSTMVDAADHCEAGAGEGAAADQNGENGTQCVVLTLAPSAE